jgi:hypothetical protein
MQWERAVSVLSIYNRRGTEANKACMMVTKLDVEQQKLRVGAGGQNGCIAHRISVWHVCYHSGQRPRHFIEDTGVCALPQPPWIGACAAIGCLRLRK